MLKIFSILFLILTCVACGDTSNETEFTPDPALVYFLVGENELHHGESFILPLKNPDDIAEARRLISVGEKKILIAEISNNNKDNYSINKDLLQDRKWSWHVTGFLGFADFSIEILDGWPGYVEENYQAWVENTKGENQKGRIGFWNYSVVREVNTSELY